MRTADFPGGWGVPSVKLERTHAGVEWRRHTFSGVGCRLLKDLCVQVSYEQLCVRARSSDERGLERDWGGMRVLGRAATKEWELI